MNLELWNNLDYINLNEAIGFTTLSRDNIDLIRIKQLSNIYFTRQMRPLIDSVNIIAFASSNIPMNKFN